MAILNIRTYPDPVLQKACNPVDVVDETIQGLLQDMAETMYAENGVGLAAPQVGINVRAVVVDVRRGEQEDGLLKLINPKIIEKEGKIKSEEGCLSLPDMVVEVERAEKVTVEALQPDGKSISIEAEGILAIALQHELDHLDGVLLVDRLSSLRRSLYHRKRTREHSRAAAS
jgi:peptide deformylase